MWFVLFLESVSLLGDFFVKKAVIHPAKKITYLILGFLIYGFSAFGWYYIMKQYTFITSNFLHALFTVLIGLGLGVFVFKEDISRNEAIGCFFGIIALWFLFKK